MFSTIGIMHISKTTKLVSLSAVLSTPIIILLMLLSLSQRFTHPPWYYETARTPLQGLNYNFGSTNWLNGKTNPKYDHNLTYIDVEMIGPYGSTLRGWLIPAENSTKGVVGVHGAGLDRREFLKLAPLLHKIGYHFLLFDCREHGISSGSMRGFSFGIREHADIVSAVRWFKKNYNLRKVAVIGTSQGGTSTILAASIADEIDAIFVENPFMSFDSLLQDVITSLLSVKPEWATNTSPLLHLGNYIPHWFRFLLKQITIWKVRLLAGEGDVINALDVIHKLHQPIYLIHGSKDSLIPVTHTMRLFQRAREPKLLWVAEGCEHCAIYNKYPNEYAEKLTKFLATYL